MILESILSLSLTANTPKIPAMNLATFSMPARSIVIGKYGKSSFGATSSFRSSSSFSRPSSSSFSRPSSSSFSRPSSSSFSRPATPVKISPAAPVKAPSISSPSTSTIKSTSSAPSVIRVNKQTVPKPPSTVSAPTPKSTAAPAPTVITRERYIERYNDSGIAGNPWFWMYMFNNNNRPAYAAPAPTQVIVKNDDGEEVKVPASQMIVKKYSYDPLREFMVFSLGSGLTVLAARQLIKR